MSLSLILDGTVRVSSLQKWMDCPFASQSQNAPSRETEIGSLFHSLVQNLPAPQSQVIDGDDERDVEEVAAAFLYRFPEYMRAEDWAFEREVTRGNLMGHIDATRVSDGAIHEFKTTSSDPTSSRYYERYLTSLQCTAYCYLNHVDHVTYRFARMPPREGPRGRKKPLRERLQDETNDWLHEMDFYRSLTQIENFERDIDWAMRQIAAGHYPRTPGMHCAYCDQKRTCYL